MTRWVDGVEVVDDLAPTAWIPPHVLGWGRGCGTRVGAVVPAGFEAYARLPHPAQTGPESWTSWKEIARQTGRTAHARMQWGTITHQQDGRILEVEGGPGESLPRHLTQRLVSTLGRHTSTPQTCWFPVWEGYGNLPETGPARLELPGRRYVVLARTTGDGG